jgi:hypothetical protein
VFSRENRKQRGGISWILIAEGLPWRQENKLLLCCWEVQDTEQTGQAYRGWLHLLTSPEPSLMAITDGIISPWGLPNLLTLHRVCLTPCAVPWSTATLPDPLQATVPLYWQEEGSGRHKAHAPPTSTRQSTICLCQCPCSPCPSWLLVPQDQGPISLFYPHHAPFPHPCTQTSCECCSSFSRQGEDGELWSHRCTTCLSPYGWLAGDRGPNPSGCPSSSRLVKGGISSQPGPSPSCLLPLSRQAHDYRSLPQMSLFILL